MIDVYFLKFYLWKALQDWCLNGVHKYVGVCGRHLCAHSCTLYLNVVVIVEAEDGHFLKPVMPIGGLVRSS